MHVVLLIALALLLVVGPSLWVKSVMTRYSVPKNRYPRTGGEVARELLDALALRQVRTEITDAGDHYDPTEKVVRLSRANFEGRSLTAVTVSAHEDLPRARKLLAAAALTYVAAALQSLLNIARWWTILRRG